MDRKIRSKAGQRSTPYARRLSCRCLARSKEPETWIASSQSLIRQLANPPERMAGRDPLLDRDLEEQGAAAPLLASQQRMGRCPILAEVTGFFSELLSDQ